MNGINHFLKLNNMIGYATHKGVKQPKLMVMLSGLLLIIGGLGILGGGFVPYFGGFEVLVAVASLVVFLIPTTFIMHAFWKETDPNARAMEYVAFTKNLALLGGVLAFLFVK